MDGGMFSMVEWSVLAASRLLGNCQCYKGWSECRCPLSCKTAIFLYIYIIIYLWKRHWWYYKLLTLSTFGSHHVPQHVFSPCQPTWATSRQSSNGLLTQIWTKIGWPQIWFDGLSSFCTFNWQFWIISQFLRKVWIDTCVFFCHLSGHLLLLHAKPGQTWLATASCDTHGISPCHGWLACLRNERPPISVVSLQQILNMLWTILGFWLPLWKRWRTWMKWTPFEPRYPTRKVPCGSLWHNTRYTFGANPCQENHIENQFVLHHHIVLVCHLNNNFLASQPLHTLWNVHECSKSCK